MGLIGCLGHALDLLHLLRGLQATRQDGITLGPTDARRLLATGGPLSLPPRDELVNAIS
jgi:hypothetical protein